VFIYAIIGSIASLIIVGIFVIMAVGICSMIFPILGAIKASKGEIWKYPYSITFFQTGIPQQTSQPNTVSSSPPIKSKPIIAGCIILLLLGIVTISGLYYWRSLKKREVLLLLKEREQIEQERRMDMAFQNLEYGVPVEVPKEPIEIPKKSVEPPQKPVEVLKKSVEPPKKLYTPETIEKQIDAVSAEHAEWQLQNEEKQAIKDFLLRLQKNTGEGLDHSDIQCLLEFLKGLPGSYKPTINLWNLEGMDYFSSHISSEISREIIEKSVREKSTKNIDTYIVNCVWLDHLIDRFGYNFSSVAENQLRISLGGETQLLYEIKEDKKKYYDRIKAVESMLPESNRLSGNAHDTIEQLRLKALKSFEDKIKSSIESEKQKKAAGELF
jgi:hypothetical protein